MNKYWCDYNILINISPFFVVALVKKFTIEHFPGLFTFIFHCNISVWALDFVAAFSFPFFVLCHIVEHSICICFPFTLTYVCLYVVKNLSNKSVISIFSSHVCFCFSRFSLFQSRYSCKKKNLKQQNYKSLNLWSQLSWTFYVIYSRIKKDHEKIKTSFLNLIQCRMKHFSI